MDKLKKFSKTEFSRFAFQWVWVVVAGLLGGIAFKTFFEPFGIIPTGFSGLSLIVHNSLLSVINIPTSLIYLAFNVVIFIFALRVFGWKFLLLALSGTAAYILAMQYGYIEALANASDERLLFAVVGGMLSGAAIGFGIRMGGSTGGTEILGAIMNKKFPNLKTGYCILMMNIGVIVLSILTAGVQTGLYALVIAVISSFSTNLVLNNSKRVVAYYIICDNDEEVANAILQMYHRGVTKINAQGMFSKKEKSLLLCLIPFEQAAELKKLVKHIDPNSFVFSEHVDETLGDGDFLIEASIYKNKIKNAQNQLKTRKKFQRLAYNKKMEYPKRRTRFKLYNKEK